MSTPTKLNTAMNEAPVTEPITLDEEEVIDVDALEEENLCQIQAKIAATKAKNDAIAKKKKVKEDQQQIKAEQKKADEEQKVK